jgi:hypothetical protein
MGSTSRRRSLVTSGQSGIETGGRLEVILFEAPDWREFSLA